MRLYVFFLDFADSASAFPADIYGKILQFSWLEGGIISKDCGTKLDHGVLLVGYGNSGGQPLIPTKCPNFSDSVGYDMVNFPLLVTDCHEFILGNGVFDSLTVDKLAGVSQRNCFVAELFRFQVVQLFRSSILDHQELLGPPMGGRRLWPLGPRSGRRRRPLWEKALGIWWVKLMTKWWLSLLFIMVICSRFLFWICLNWWNSVTDRVTPAEVFSAEVWHLFRCSTHAPSIFF